VISTAQDDERQAVARPTDALVRTVDDALHRAKQHGRVRGEVA